LLIIIQKGTVYLQIIFRDIDLTNERSKIPRVNQKWTIHSSKHHNVHKTKTSKNKNTTQYVLDPIMRKVTQVT